MLSASCQPFRLGLKLFMKMYLKMSSAEMVAILSRGREEELTLCGLVTPYTSQVLVNLGLFGSAIGWPLKENPVEF